MTDDDHFAQAFAGYKPERLRLRAELSQRTPK